MHWRNPGSVYFIGIGGIGMSALARWFMMQGARVAGYDRTSTPLTSRLQQEGISIHFDDDPELIPEGTELVVYTPAIPPGHREFRHLKNSGLPVMKRAEVLGMIASDYTTVAVAGTHGKTTTSGMIAHLLTTAGFPVIAFLGGISKNYGTNLVVTAGKDPSRLPVCIVEADEYDRSFLHLSPDIAIITSVDPDHLDIYDTHESMTTSYGQFAARIRPGGKLILKEGIRLPMSPVAEISLYNYAIGQGACFQACDVEVTGSSTRFGLRYPGGYIANLMPGLPGLFNLENAVAASAVSLLLGADDAGLRSGLASFRGIGRRFDFRIRRDDLVYIDDYAHHPEEIKACISAVRTIYPGRKITGIFQPHLFSRTRDLADAFARSLELLDRLILLEIYPAREEPLPGINSAWLLDKINLPEKRLARMNEVIPVLISEPPDILLTLGAGDIDQLAEPVENLFKEGAPG